MKIFFTKILIIICWLSMTCESNAQILPPDFICVKGDTLIWQPTPNSCGSFVGYYIFFSDSPNGPYTLLEEINDPSQLFYEHINPSDLTWYYYLQSGHNCPGEVPTSSDTLDNRSPATTEIDAASVEGNDVRISWSQNPSPETEGYIIYRLTPSGTIPIDTVFNQLDYLDTNADPTNQSETYYVLAVDPCGNTSLFGTPHRTILMDGSTSECEQLISLNWSPYDAWSGGISRHEIWVSENGSPAQAVDTISGTLTEYLLQKVGDGVEYCISVKAISNDSGAGAFSNEICLTPSVITPVSELVIKNVDVQSDGNVELTWLWNTDARIKSAAVFYTLEGDDVVNSSTQNFSFPLSRENQFTETSDLGNRGVLTYQVQTFDDCDSMQLTDFANPIFLSIAPNGLTNQLTWTPLQIASAEVESYDILKIEGGNSTSIGQVDASTFEFEETLVANDVGAGEICYRIRANSMFTFPNGSEQSIRSHSNQVCQNQSAKIWMPNAFNPRGRNQIFKPVVAYGVPKTYRMLIFNRWGEVIFQSDKIEEGWNGKIGVQDALGGIYTYLVQLTGQDDSAENFSGAVMLVR